MLNRNWFPTMSWTELNFGKHSGKTLPQVVFHDPDWFFWAMEKNIFVSGTVRLRMEAEDVNRKARRIKVPKAEGEKQVVEYWIHHPTKKFSHFDLVPEDRPHHTGSSPTFRSKVVDMSVPRRIASYDKTGCRSLVRSLKSHMLGGANVKLTKSLCEAFFDELGNFEYL